MFGSQCTKSNQDKVKSLLNVGSVASEEKYLGLPTPDERMHRSKFKLSKECLAKKVTHWEERFMSYGAKEVLIKAVAQAIPTYMMAVFKLPATLCDEFTKMVQDF
jgi:hypothetical protein